MSIDNKGPEREDFMPSVVTDKATKKDFNVWDTVLSQEVWNKKYKAPNDRTISDTMYRVAGALFPEDAKKCGRAAELMLQSYLVPAGRILSGAGTDKRVTLMNCYVMGKMEDSLDDIFKTLSHTALTMQQGGGTGTDFSPLRPKGAVLKRTGSSSSGPLTFMDTWDAMCKTIMSAGHRRGAMMATMRIDHPDIRDFITAKHEAGRLKNFNVSVLVTDEFMFALKNNLAFHLRHESSHVDWTDAQKDAKRIHVGSGSPYYVWETVQAAELWELLTRNSYEYSEPGVIFIDRINNTNNLRDVEKISCTNPCGEQPLPPYGACDLGHINLARMILRPYSPAATVDMDQLDECVRLMVELLDNVIDVTNYPLPEQKAEMLYKRRIGLGITGLADALAMVGWRYGSSQAVAWTENVMREIARIAYTRSMELSREKGKAPAFNPNTFNWNFLGSLGVSSLMAAVKEHGLRNCVMMTIAPTGTTSAFYGNVSSGCEPTFAHRIKRKIRQPDDSYKEFVEYSYSVRAYAHVHNISLEEAFETCSVSPHLFPTVNDLTIKDHINMQAACQRWVDASISKTINIPAETPYETFEEVYLWAYEAGLKGCTTYRPSEVRGSILEEAKPTKKEVVSQAPTVSTPVPSSSAVAQLVEKKSKERPEALEGRTYKIKWPAMAAAVYVTINHNDFGQIEEVFIASKNSQYNEWAVALSVVVSKLLKVTNDPIMVANELMQINLSSTPSWKDGRFYGSLIAYIGNLIRKHADEVSDMAELESLQNEQFVVATIVEKHVGEDDTGPIVLGTSHRCTACGGFNVKMKEGCMSCDDCGQSNCN